MACDGCVGVGLVVRLDEADEADEAAEADGVFQGKQLVQCRGGC